MSSCLWTSPTKVSATWDAASASKPSGVCTAATPESAATGHLAGLPHLKGYYAGQTCITDRSLKILARMQSLERLTFAACAGMTNAGVTALAALPRLRELTLELMPGVTRQAVMSFPAHIRVSFET